MRMRGSMRGTRQRSSLRPHWFHILLSLADRDLHGLQIMEEVRARTHGDVHLWPGMLYGSLKQMTDEGLVVETDAPKDAEPGGGRPRYYRITKDGRRALSAEVARLSGYVAAALAKNVT
jgi:DNA-binding PadR family transcriptional regulator